MFIHLNNSFEGVTILLSIHEKYFKTHLILKKLNFKSTFPLNFITHETIKSPFALN